MLNPINLTPYPINNHQSVYTAEGNTTLELVGVIAKKMNEAIDVVNGVDVLASQSRQIVGEMQTSQQEFITANNDTRTQLIADNNSYLAQLTTDKESFKASLNTEIDEFTTQSTSSLNSLKASFDLANANYQASAEQELSDFQSALNVDKTAFENTINETIQNSHTQITTDVGTKIDGLVTDGTLSNMINQELLTGINTEVKQHEVVVSEVEPTESYVWYDIKSNTPVDIPEDVVFVEL